MKKTLLSTTIALGFVGAAGAQTSVTLYGIADGGFGYTQFKDKNPAATAARAANANLPAPSGDRARQTGLSSSNQSTSVWGILGEEDLGGGLRAGFHLESGWDLMTGHLNADNKLFNEVAILSLSGDSWGTLAFGRQYTWGAQYMPYIIAAHGDDFSLGHVGASFTAAGTPTHDNTISYETPEFAGFQLGLGYSFNTDGAQPYRVSGTPNTDASAFSAALRYSTGPLTLGASYDQLNTFADPTLPNPGKLRAKAWILGASYDFDVASLHLGFGQEKNGTLTGRGGDDIGLGDYYFFQDGYVGDGYKTNNYSVGVSVPLESSNVSFNWHSARLGSSQYKDDVLAAGGKRSQNIYTLVYTYDLSKRTNVYAFGTYGTGYAFNDMSVSQVVVGLRHNF